MRPFVINGDESPSVTRLDPSSASWSSRRLFLQRLAAIGLAAGPGAALLAACGTSGENEGGQGGGGLQPGSRLVYGVDTLGTDIIGATHLGNAVGERAAHWAYGEPLLRIDPQTRELRPGLADSWELSDDLRTWTFRLHEGIPFHDNRGQLTTADVRFTWELFFREDSVHPRTADYREMVGESMDNFEVVDDYAFRIHTPQPMVTMTEHLQLGAGGGAMVIHSKAYWEEVGDEEAIAKPIGTGPWKFVSHEPGVNVILEAVRDHWRKSPEFETLEIRVVADSAAALAEVQTGDVDLVAIALTQVPEAEASDVRVEIIPDAGLSNVYLGGSYLGDDTLLDRDAPWIQADNPERGLAIRKALSYAIDRQSIVDNLLMGAGAPAAAPSFFTPGKYLFIDPSWKPHPHDPDQARAFLAEGGYPDGFEVEMAVFAQSGRPHAEDVAEAVANYWEEIGITVNRHPMEYSPTWISRMQARDTRGWVYQFTQTFADELATRFTLFSPTSPGENASYYHPAVDEFTTPALSEPDPEKRNEYIRQLGDVLRDDVWMIPIASVSTPMALSANVGDVVFLNGTGDIRTTEYISPAS